VDFLPISHIDFKAGKLLRIAVELDSGHISYLRLYGDFFIYPEEAIDDIEKLLIGLRPEDIVPRLKSFIEGNHIQLIGFSPEDLKSAISKAF